MERTNPAFKELVKIAITPMLSTLSILNFVNIDSEQEMLGYGMGSLAQSGNVLCGTCHSHPKNKIKIKIN